MTAPKSVDGYLAALPEDKRAALQRLRDTISSAAPDASEAISYGMPAFKDQGRVLVYYAAFKDHCSFFPASGVVLDRFVSELGGRRVSKGTIRFTVDDQLPKAIVRKIVKARLAENASRRKASPRRG